MRNPKSSRTKCILGVGAAFVDHIILIEDRYLEQLPYLKGSVNILDTTDFHSLLQTCLPQRIAVTPGGSCANVVRGLRELGWPCTLTGKIGDDDVGHWLLSDLKQRNITISYTYDKKGTAQAICLITPDGERTMCDYLGASIAMHPSDLQPGRFDAADLVHIEGYSLLQEGLTERAMQLAKAANAWISFDLASFSIVEKYRELLEYLIQNYVSLLFANASEARALTGLTAAEACQKLSTWCGYVVVTDGANGSYISNNGSIIHYPTKAITKIIDTTGAGDLYTCGFLDGWLKKMPLEQCAAQGTLLATTVIQQAGASLPASTWQSLKISIV